MTELSYTAWDDNRYQWPPPEGWYQAVDGKWWPEGYGPVANQAAAEASTESNNIDLDPVDDDGQEDIVSGHDGAGAVGDEWIDETAEVADEVDADFDSGFDTASDVDVNGAVVEVDVGFDNPSDADTNGAVEEFDASAEPVSAAAANGAGEHAETLDTGGDAEFGEADPGIRGEEESTSSIDSRYDTESQLSTSTAGMAASGFASQDEGEPSSFGLAGWAETGSSEVGNQVDISHEYDYSVPESETENLLDPVGGPDDAPGFDNESGYVDTPTEPVESTLTRLDDLKRQVEQQSFSTDLGGTGAAAVSSLDDGSGFDPTETLDIEPNDLSIDTNPYYGGAEESSSADLAQTVATEAPATVDGLSGEHDGAAPDAVHGYDERGEAGSGGYGFSPAGEATIDAASAAETRQFGYEGEAPPPVVDQQPAPASEPFAAPEAEYQSGPVLTPMSSPPPKPGRGRTVLYAIVGLVALAVAGFAGYLLFQLQSDDGETGTGDGSAATAAGANDAGPSDTGGEGPGSFSNPHELAGGVRLTVPIADQDDEVWMLQVREPATTVDLGNDLVEVTSRLRIRNDSTSGELAGSGLRFVLVAADGSTGTTAEASCSSGDDLNLDTAIEPGKDIEGNVCWAVPAPQANGALLGIESMQAGGRVHVQLG